MKRWSGALKKDVENPKVDAFLADISEVYRKHGLGLYFDDYSGGLEVVPLEARVDELLEEAQDLTGITLCSLGQRGRKPEMLSDGTYVMRDPKTGVAYSVSTGEELPCI